MTKHLEEVLNWSELEVAVMEGDLGAWGETEVIPVARLRIYEQDGA